MGTQDFTSRPATPHDAEQIVHVQRKAVEKAWAPLIKENFAQFLAEKFDHATQVKKYAERASDPARIMFVVEKDNQIIGFAAVREHGPEEQPLGFHYQATALYIDPAFEGKGASVILLMGMAREMKSRGAKNLCGWCLADNRLARNFYEKRGGTLSFCKAVHRKSASGTERMLLPLT